MLEYDLKVETQRCRKMWERTHIPKALTIKYTDEQGRELPVKIFAMVCIYLSVACYYDMVESAFIGAHYFNRNWLAMILMGWFFDIMYIWGVDFLRYRWFIPFDVLITAVNIAFRLPFAILLLVRFRKIMKVGYEQYFGEKDRKAIAEEQEFLKNEAEWERIKKYNY